MQLATVPLVCPRLDLLQSYRNAALPRRLPGPKQATQRRGHLVAHARQNVTVGIHRQADPRVAEHLLDQLRVHVRGQQRCGDGMAEVVKPNCGQAALAQLGRKTWRTRITGLNRCTVPGREDEAEVLPGRSRFQPLFGVVGLVGLERPDGLGRHRERPFRTLGLRGTEKRISGAGIQRLSDDETPGGKIDVLPAQTEQLPLSHTGCQRHHEQGCETVALGFLQQGAALVRLCWLLTRTLWGCSPRVALLAGMGPLDSRMSPNKIGRYHLRAAH